MWLYIEKGIDAVVLTERIKRRQAAYHHHTVSVHFKA
jgi:hypothetical protein